MDDEYMLHLIKHTTSIIDEMFKNPRPNKQVQESLPPEECSESCRECENGHEITWEKDRC